jgi:hypothetical protein
MWRTSHKVNFGESGRRQLLTGSADLENLFTEIRGLRDGGALGSPWAAYPLSPALPVRASPHRFADCFSLIADCGTRAVSVRLIPAERNVL